MNQRDEMRNRSGNVNTKSNLVAFFYELLRDHLPGGEVESIVINSTDPTNDYQLTNGWLANYAKDIVRRLLLTEKDRELIGYIITELHKKPFNGEKDGELRLEASAMLRRLAEL